jgi:hypothetical protein
MNMAILPLTNVPKTFYEIKKASKVNSGSPTHSPGRGGGGGGARSTFHGVGVFSGRRLGPVCPGTFLRSNIIVSHDDWRNCIATHNTPEQTIKDLVTPNTSAYRDR